MNEQPIAWASARRDRDGRQYWLVWAGVGRGQVECYGATYDATWANTLLLALAARGYRVDYVEQEAVA